MSRNVIYCTTGSESFPDVAKRLEREHGIKPQYWVTAELKKEVRTRFPNIAIHDSYEAMYGGFHNEYDYDNLVPIDSELLSYFDHYEATALQMMNRIDLYNSTREPLTYQKRVRMYHRQLSYWLSVIGEVNPDLVVFGATPHLVYDYIIYAICEYMNIETVIFTHTNLPGRFAVRNRIHEKIINSDRDNNNLNLSVKNRKYLEELRGDYSQAEPEYMKLDKNNLTKSLINTYAYLQYFSKLPYKVLKLFGKKLWGMEISEGRKSEVYNRSSVTRLALEKVLPKYHRYRLSEGYESMCVDTNILSSKYIYFPLHYQPERTTLPEGGKYAHQHLAIKMLASATSEETSIFVKEHPSQFCSRLHGHKGRSVQDYRESDSISGVKLISMDSNPFELIDKSEAVATVTGTAGWEALVRGTPSLVFGNSWYRSAPGCYYVKTMAQLENSIESVYDHNILDEEIDQFVATAESETYEGTLNTESDGNLESLYNALCENAECIKNS